MNVSWIVVDNLCVKPTWLVWNKVLLLPCYSFYSFHTNTGRWLNTLRPKQNGRYFPDIFKCIFLNENVRMSIRSQCSMKFVRRDSINKILASVQIMAWRRPGDKPLSGPMMVDLLTHICVTWPQWVKPQRPQRHVILHDNIINISNR